MSEQTFSEKLDEFKGNALACRKYYWTHRKKRLELNNRMMNRKLPSRIEYLRKYHKIWCENNREKRNAQQALQRAVRNGHVIRPPFCDDCGLKSKIYGHHHDYSKPLSVKWLCHKCHEKVHHQDYARKMESKWNVSNKS